MSKKWRIGPEAAFPCSLCLRIAKLSSVTHKVRRMATKFLQVRGDKSPLERTPLGRPFLRLERALGKWEQGHPRCSTCTMLFGGYHLARASGFHKHQPICQWCAKEKMKYGGAVLEVSAYDDAIR